MRSPLSAVVVEYYGGAPGRVGPAESAFAQRGAEYNVGMMAQWARIRPTVPAHRLGAGLSMMRSSRIRAAATC